MLKAITLWTLTLIALQAIAARADTIQSGLSDPTESLDLEGSFVAYYDPAVDFFAATRVEFELAGPNNLGVFAIDDSPAGWIDPQANLWDLTVDGIGGEISSGLGSLDDIDISMFLADSVRLVNDGVDAYVAWTSTLGLDYQQAVSWDGIQVPEPEISGYVLLASIGAVLTLIGWRK